MFSDYSSIPQSRRLYVYTDAQGRHVCQRLKEAIPRWFLSPLDGELYYYQHLLLNIALRSEIGLLSNSNIYEECYLRKQEEDAISSLEDAAKRSFSVHYIHRLALAKMLILQNREAE